MLYKLLYQLEPVFGALNVLKYLTFRVAFAAITSFLICVIFGPKFIAFLHRRKLHERTDKTDSPFLAELNRDRGDTPTMGGLLIVVSTILASFLWADPSNLYVLLASICVLWLGLVGYIDDNIKLRDPSKKGLTTRVKFIAQILIAVVIALSLMRHYQGEGIEWGRLLQLPFVSIKFFAWTMPVFIFIPFVVAVMVGTSNAVNLSDGVDGLAPGCMVMVAGSFAALSYISGHKVFSEYLFIQFVPGAGELAVFCSALAGATLGFLWFNCHPAQVFMGDTGSLPLGGAIGFVAVAIKQELLLFIIGGIFVAEAVSVILQVLYYKRTKRRLFKIAPLHHHFQYLGWADSKVTTRFWIISALLAAFGVATLKLR